MNWTLTPLTSNFRSTQIVAPSAPDEPRGGGRSGMVEYPDEYFESANRFDAADTVA